MRIGVFSDLHESSTMWRRVNELSEGADFLLSAGDITPIQKQGDITLFSIYGNHDDLEEIFSGSSWLHDGLNLHRGMAIYAVNGNFAKKARERWHKDPFILADLFRNWNHDKVDIAVTHEPPEGVLWRKGRYSSPCSEMVTDFIAGIRPRIWFYGHSFISEPIQVIKGIKTVNVNKRFVIFDPESNVCKIFKLSSPFINQTKNCLDVV